ncbi:COQ9 family protein [Arenibaculum pallidiluteum]|uniref:COQ9 family protein n=1 Tax=Arenibaculum pallidiluteum TaxID=2812559 RepID=UPI001A97BB0A|nr:COQ9 family protein [Arenibaculum pallidiluteum]
MTGAAYDETETALRDELLLATLPNIAFDGWSAEALRAGAASAGQDWATARRLFPEGVPELVDHFADWADRQMLAGLATLDLDSMRVRDRIRTAVRLRLEILAPHREAVRRSIAWFALPQNASQGVRQLMRTVDRIWIAAGDVATDHNWYTKRGLLAGVVSATTLYWLDDASEDLGDSWGFLDRRLDDVMRVGRATSRIGGLGNLGRIARVLPSPARFLRQFRRDMREA